MSSARLRLRHCHRIDTAVSSVEHTDEGENQAAIELYLWPRSDHRITEHWTSSYHCEGNTERRYDL